MKLVCPFSLKDRRVKIDPFDKARSGRHMSNVVDNN